MPVSVNVQTVHRRKLAAVRREVPPGAVGAAWGPALGKVWPFIRSQPGLWIDGHNIFLYHHSSQPGAPILCEFGVEVTRTFETGGDVYATETPAGEAAVAVHRGPYNRMNEAHDAIRKWMAANPQGVRWLLVGDIWGPGSGSGRHRDDDRVSPKVAFMRFGRVVGIPYRGRNGAVPSPCRAFSDGAVQMRGMATIRQGGQFDQPAYRPRRKSLGYWSHRHCGAARPISFPQNVG